MKTKNKTTLHLRKSIGRSPLRLGFLLIPLALACFALSPTARAQLNPPPDGGYPDRNTAEGDLALFRLTTGGDNTAIGNQALFSNTTGNDNTAIGAFALNSNTTGNSNTANGSQALFSNTTGNSNTAIGNQALFSNTTGNSNTASGDRALQFNTTGSDNTANGSSALFDNTTGRFNTANGVSALQDNTTGSGNTANGLNALFRNTTGNDNTASGVQALFRSSTGRNNTANGVNALLENTTGNDNTADGRNALFSNTTGSDNIALGVEAGLFLTTGSNNIEIGNRGVAREANTIRIGTVGTQQATFIAGISGKIVPGGVTVVVGANGHLGTVVSSRRFKDEIKPMDKASEAILALKPVTFRYKHELDPDSVPQFGLVAEEVEKVSPDLVARDAEGKVYTVRYEAVNAMLLNEFIKEHRKVQEQQKEIAALAAQLKKQAMLIQKVSDRLELNKATPRVVNNQ